MISLHPSRGGFKGFPCGMFIRSFLMERGDRGAPQTDIFHTYKTTLINLRAESRAETERDRLMAMGKSLVDIDFDALSEKYRRTFPFKTTGARYHSFAMYFSTLIKLGWVEPTGEEEPSLLQDRNPNAPSRRYYHLTGEGRGAPDEAWANPYKWRYPVLGMTEAREEEIEPAKVQDMEMINQGILDTVVEKWREATTKRVSSVVKDLDNLEGQGFDISEARDALEEFQAITRSDYDSAEEYREARDESWDSFLEALESAVLPDIEQ